MNPLSELKTMLGIQAANGPEAPKLPTRETVSEPDYADTAGATVREILDEMAGKPVDKGDGPRPVDVEDMLVVENFLAFTRRHITKKLDAAGAAGDAKETAKWKARSHAIDEFVRVVMPGVRAATLERIEERAVADLISGDPRPLFGLIGAALGK